ncbi:DNA phosphorothioation-dependent restriction protein DptH [Plebeiibacterium sediminum]|uniref:DNA phosphorothioation-dependent restriction protein DptH n=1 Tax=Plebeiibacterium sediminum TaxID=2992112 RepID=A0AAE3SHU9_9BACT|nr:DNA phosphorothioation-dependent restriction protein DptH [Plebeiobacterium sediminum]MCW3788493.1 DNA phosphorothioation-dependent restriction protein DptH [Plebeiobacterium sediminum]
MKSDLIYNFLAQGIIEYFKNTTLTFGASYHANFEEADDVAGIYKALFRKAGLENIREIFQHNKYSTFAIDFKNAKLLIAGNSHDVGDHGLTPDIHEDFLTAIRNYIKAQEELYKGYSVLFLHNTELDSIIGGAQDLATKEYPLHIASVKDAIQRNIKSSNNKLPEQEKKVLTYLIKHQGETSYDIDRSIFDYGVYLKVLENQKIEDKDYQELGIFKDESILKGIESDTENKKRLKHNIELHEEISNGHQYGNIDQIVERKYDESIQKKLKNRELCFYVTYDQLIKSIERRKNIKGIEYKPNETGYNKEWLKCRDIAQGNSSNQQRIRNIILFNPDKKDLVTASLEFKSKPSDKKLQFKKDSLINPQIEGNTIELVITFSEEQNITFFEKFEYVEEIEGKILKHQFKLLILPFDQSILEEHIDDIKVTSKGSIEITSSDLITINPGHESSERVAIVEGRNYNLESKKVLHLFNGEETYTETGKISFSIFYEGNKVPFEFKLGDTIPRELNKSDLFNIKYCNKKEHLFYSERIDETKDKTIQTIYHNASKFYPALKMRKQLAQEYRILTKLDDEQGIFFVEALDGITLLDKKIDLPIEIEEAYSDIIKYLNQGDKVQLPSIAYIDEKLTELYLKYLESVKKIIDNIEYGTELTSTQENIFKIGTVISSDRDKYIKYTSLHPLNVAYQLHLKDEIDTEVPKEIIERFNSNNLLPYLRGVKKDFYHVTDSEEALFWTHYIKEETDGQIASKRFVPRLVREKVIEFTEHFSYLFLDKNAPIKINLVNQGDCGEILQGVFSYFTTLVATKGKAPDELSPIEVNIYGSEDYITKFELFSKYDEPDSIKEVFGIDLYATANKMEPYDLLKLYNEKVNFYNREQCDATYEYAHITFFQFCHDHNDNNQVSFTQNNMDSMDSGISLNGLMSDPATNYEGGAYWTSFGTRETSMDKPLISLAKQYNEVVNILNTPGKLEKDKTIALTVKKEVKTQLNEIYKSSQWTTFIDPKVDLSFFKSDKDVVIIHYSDLYTSSGNYDAITVTKKWEQYRDVIYNYLNQQGINVTEEDVIPIINIFNAINGDWLLKIASHSKRLQFDKEKISILSAVKEMLAILYHDDITWVPISLEEILRVAGSIALPTKEGILSTKNHGKEGKFSDDILMIGIESFSQETILHFHPVEVKIGVTDQERKGKEQGAKTAEFLEEVLGDSTIKGKVYRNFFAKQLISTVEKLILYEIWPANDAKWDIVNRLKVALLNDKFKIGTHLQKHIGKYSVLSFRANENFSPRKVNLEGSAQLIQLLETDGLRDLKLSVEDLITRVHSEISSIPADHLLKNSYKSNEAIIENPSMSECTEELGNLNDDTNDSSPLQNEVLEPLVNDNNEMKVLFGTEVNSQQKMNWYPTSTDKVMHTNTGIIGTMGTGKTQFTKSLITQLVQNSHANVDQKQIGVLIFDYKGDYIKSEFTDITGAKVYELHKLPYNPLALSIDNNPKPLLPLHTASTLKDTISKAFNLGNKQKALLRDLILESYENKGIHKNIPDTWSKSAPTIADVAELYLSNEDSSIDSLHAALTELYEYEIFEPVGNKAIPLFELLKGVTVINLSGYSPEIQNLVVAITLDLFYSQMQNNGHSKIKGNYRQLNKMILVDEADNFLSKNFESLRKILKEGREYGVGTILSTQFLNHFSTGDNEYSNYILTWIIHRVNEIKDKEVASLFDIQSKAERDELIGVIKSLEKHYSIVNLAGSAPIKIKDKAFWELIKEKV